MSNLSDCCNAIITIRKGKDDNGEYREQNICSRCHHVILSDNEKAEIINKKSSKFLNRIINKIKND